MNRYKKIDDSNDERSNLGNETDHDPTRKVQKVKIDDDNSGIKPE